MATEVEDMPVETGVDNQHNGTEQSPDEFLTNAVEKIHNSGNEDTPADADKSTEKTGEADRGTQAASDKGATDQSNGDRAAKASASNSAAAESGKVEPKSRAQERIHDLLEQVKQRDAKIAQWEQEKAAAQAEKAKQPQEPKVILPQPTKPKYEQQQLLTYRQQIAAKIRSGEATPEDYNLLEGVDGELRAWDKYETDLKFWKLENGQAVERWQGAQTHFRNEALKAWPELKDASSPLSQVYRNIEKKFPEVANRNDGDGTYWVANMAHLVLAQEKHEAELGALKTANETLTKENQALKGKMQPANQRGAAETGKASSNGNSIADVDRDFSQRLRELRSAKN